MDIPSTDVIRHWRAWGADEDFSSIRVLQFEAWLAQVEAAARAAERERIIKLLEDEGSSTFSLAYIISLIKGENK